MLNKYEVWMLTQSELLQFYDTHHTLHPTGLTKCNLSTIILHMLCAWNHMEDTDGNS